MHTFDQIIGYETIKNELMQITDMIHNRDVYTRLGAKLPHGILLYGDPGLGKTLMAKCFIDECGLTAYTVRRAKGTADFVGEITAAFKKAKETAPAIVFLDDMDKFANEDMNHRDAEEYVALQSSIDEVKDCDVFVLATANNTHKLPNSLIRSGRFDKKIEVCPPTATDACAIIKHYLKDKKLGEDVSVEDITMMIQYSSCAELETILNEAAILAAFARRECIAMQDIVNAVLRMEYNAPDNYTKPSEDDLKKTALHEAGHLVICEVLCPGSVGLASIRARGRDATGGFVRRCKTLKRRPHNVLVSLGGKAAVEMYYADTCASGCFSDINHAYTLLRDGMTENGTHGFGMIDVATNRIPNTSESLNARGEAVTQAELERYMLKSRDILLKNRDFLEKAASALLEKETLLHSDVKAIRESVTVTDVAV